jgi:hypothetical protein
VRRIPYGRNLGFLDRTSLEPSLKTPWLESERTIPTERPPLVGEVSANFCGSLAQITSPEHSREILHCNKQKEFPTPLAQNTSLEHSQKMLHYNNVHVTAEHSNY